MVFKKMLTVLLILSMLFSVLPAAAFAADAEIGQEEETAASTDVSDAAADLSSGDFTAKSFATEEEPQTEEEPEPEIEEEPEQPPVEENIQPQEPAPEEVIPESVPAVETPAEETAENTAKAADQEQEKTVFVEIPEEEKHVVAAIDEEGYETLQDAIDAAGEQDTDIYLLEPVEEDVEIGKNQSITISLNGHFFSGDMVNYGNLTVLGDGIFDGELITRAYHVKDGDATIDFASGTTVIKDGMFSGMLAVEQDQENPLDGGDELPTLIVEGGTFMNDEGEELIKRYAARNENGEADYTESDAAGKILLTGGVFLHYPAYAAPGYHAVDNGGMYSIEEGYDEAGQDTEEPEEKQASVFLAGEEQDVTPQENKNSLEEPLKEALTLNPEKITPGMTPPQTLMITEAEDPGFEGETKTGEEETFTITYDTEVPEGSATTYVSSTGATLPVLTDSAEKGTFAGWYLDADFTDGPYETIPTGSTGKREFYAGWKRAVLVYIAGETFGHVKYKDTPITSSKGNTVYVLPGEDFVLELIPATENCRVTKVLAGGSEVPFSSDSVTIESDNVKNKMEVYVYFDQWPTHYITFDYNDGGATENKASYIKDGIALEFEEPTRKGYEFKGWLCSKDGEIYITGSEYTVTQSADFTAQWELKNYTLTYHVNNSSVGEIPSQKFTILTDDFSLLNPAIPYADFIGWYETADFSGEHISEIEKGTDHDVDVYGKWEYNIFINYDAAAGSVTATKPIEDGKTTITTGDEVTLTATAADGYVLKEIAVKSASTAEAPQTGSAYTFKDLNEDAFFTAYFVKAYTVTFDANDGSGEKTSRTIIPGEAITLPERVRSGYQFNGWLSSEDNKVHAPGNYVPAGDVTFTAQWEKIPTYYKVYVYYNTFGTVSYNGEIVPNRSYFEVEEGKSLTMYFNPLSASYYPYNCTVNNVKKGSVSSLTLENIKENQVVSVTFAPTFARPMTGDSSRLVLWAALMAASGIACTMMIGRRKKKQK